MPVVSQWLLKRYQAFWRGAALGSHLAAWVVLVHFFRVGEKRKKRNRRRRRRKRRRAPQGALGHRRRAL
eukprot:scaffold46504_cov47-Phaeocystis_antarctica.AAC.1